MRPKFTFLNFYCTAVFVFLISTSYAQKINWIPFQWEGETIEGRYFEKFVMSVPVEVEGVPNRFKMQLDLGAEKTIIYGNTIKNYLLKYENLNQKIDTTLAYYMNSKKYPMLRDVDFKVGKVPFGKINIAYLKGFGNEIPVDSLNTASVKWLGTVAPDIFQGKILIIDYPNKRIAVTEKLPPAYAKASFQPFKLNNGRIKLPLTINGEQKDLLFDTGSSLFPLLTTETHAGVISGGDVVDSIKTSSWGDQYFVYGKKVNTTVKLGSKTLKPALVYADRKHKFDQFYQQERIWGITGNAYFLNDVLIIDYNHTLFGIM